MTSFLRRCSVVIKYNTSNGGTPLHIDSKDTRPIYVQIIDEIRRALVRGTLGPGDPLPSVRELATELRVNPRTVSQAYAELEREGVVFVRRGQGTFVSPGVRPEQRQRELLAHEVARRALADAWRNGLNLAELMAAIRTLNHELDAADRVIEG